MKGSNGLDREIGGNPRSMLCHHISTKGGSAQHQNVYNYPDVSFSESLK
jgi:hypothetical protein